NLAQRLVNFGELLSLWSRT
ncbi:lipoprotein, putative, partial [Vibrio cholerae O1 str. EC-0009]